ncbi:unnamed protein product [Calicophoron daubneyi]|uniref:Uncharacterized protein n=1 Tax=Calicophoron daubneyi TaxID=300641 RepID=A0AAV2SXF4_CALDB
MERAPSDLRSARGRTTVIDSPWYHYPLEGLAKRFGPLYEYDRPDFGEDGWSVQRTLESSFYDPEGFQKPKRLYDDKEVMPKEPGSITARGWRPLRYG